MDFLINTAHAADAATSSSGFTSLIPMLLIFAVFYFLLIRPQQKKMKEHQELVQSLGRGEKIVTAGGIIGTIKKVDDAQDAFDVEIAEGVVVKVKRATVSEVITRSVTPANDDKKAEKKTAKKQAKG